MDLIESFFLINLILALWTFFFIFWAKNYVKIPRKLVYEIKKENIFDISEPIRNGLDNFKPKIAEIIREELPEFPEIDLSGPINESFVQLTEEIIKWFDTNFSVVQFKPLLEEILKEELPIISQEISTEIITQLQKVFDKIVPSSIKEKANEIQGQQPVDLGQIIQAMALQYLGKSFGMGQQGPSNESPSKDSNLSW